LYNSNILAMSRKYKFYHPDGLNFIPFAVQGWVDIFTRNEYKDILVGKQGQSELRRITKKFTNK